MFGLYGVVISDSLAGVGNVFPGFLTWDNGMLLAFHESDWTGVQAGVPSYGRVLAIDGESWASRADLLNRVRGAGAGNTVSYEVLARGEIVTVEVRAMVFGLEEYFATFGVYAIGTLICWLTALAVIYLQPIRSDAVSLAVMLFVVGFCLLLAIDEIATTRFGGALFVAEPLTATAIISLIGWFPRKRSRSLLPGLVAGLGMLASLIHGLAAIHYFHSEPEFSRRLSDTSYLAIALALGVALTGLGYSVLRGTDSRARVRAAIVFAGAAAACVVPAVALPAFFLLGWTVSWSAVFATVFIFPVAVLYAVARHDLLDAERFIRLSLGYTVASFVSAIVFAVFVFLLDISLFPDLSDGPAVALLFVIVLVLLFNPVLNRVQIAIDRIFYRSVADAGEVLERFGAELADCDTEEEIRECVESTLRDALGLEAVCFDLTKSTAVGQDYVLNEPVVDREDPLGMIRCGEKQSGAPFARRDYDLVKGVAAQAAIAMRGVRSLDALRQAQNELFRNERLATIGELAGSVAHGIRNPLAGIRASAQIALRSTADEDAREAMDGVIAESDRLEQRVRALLYLSKPFEPTIARTALSTVVAAVESAIAPEARTRGITISVDVEPDDLEVVADANFLEEALLELVANAMGQMSEGSVGDVSIRARGNASAVEILVEDEGPGIAQEIRDRVFELFFTSRAGGTGVGLATVKRVVESMGGSIELDESRPGQGARFRLSFGR